MNREVELGPHSLSDSSPVPNRPYGFCDRNRAQELCESRGGRPGLQSLISLGVSVDVKQRLTNKINVDVTHYGRGRSAGRGQMNVSSWLSLSLSLSLSHTHTHTQVARGQSFNIPHQKLSKRKWIFRTQ